VGSEDRYFREMMARMGVAPADEGAAGPERRAPEPHSEPEDIDDAERRMFLEAVGALPPGDPMPAIEPEPEAQPAIVEEPVVDDAAERALFLEAIDRMGDVDADDFAPPARVPEKARRPLYQRLPKKARVEWDDQLDLHGLRLEEALTRVASFVARSYAGNARVIAIITGKGRSSPGGVGVLGPAVSSWIKMAGSRYVRSYAHAPRAQGGQGTLVLFLNRT